MPNEELSNDAIAMLCDIGEFQSDEATPEQRAQIQGLLDARYIQVDLDPDMPGERYKLTPKAVEFLGQRGAGLNEA
jgi:hypothetical protein